MNEETDRLIIVTLWLGLDTQCTHHPWLLNAVHALVLPEPILYLKDIGYAILVPQSGVDLWLDSRSRNGIFGLAIRIEDGVV